MAANKKIQTAELDFDDIKQNLKSFLQGQSEFQDYDFEGSAMSVLLDILAYNTHYNALYTNLAVNESFLDSASKRASVVSRAKEIGYVPYSATAATATVDVIVSSTTSSPTALTIPEYSEFSTSIDGTTYTFYNTESIVTNRVNNEYTFTNVQIKEGVPLTYTYLVGNGTRFIIPNKDVDLSTLRVRVQESQTSTSFETFVRQESIINLDDTSRVYFVKEIDDELYELEFGNNVIGKAVDIGNVVIMTYMTTSKDAANGAKVFQYNGSTLLGGVVTVVTTAPATGGISSESIESIRYNAPRSYSAQNRAVTVEDYKSLIYRLYPEAKSVNVWGGEDNIPPMYGKVFLSIQPTTTNLLTQTQKDYIKNQILKNKNVVSITPEIVDPEYINLAITANVYYNPRLTTKSELQLKSIITDAVTQYNTSNLNSFTGIFRHSNLSKVIDAADPSIMSNITTLKLHREVDVSYNTNYTYTINIGNPIYGSGVPEQSILSTGFYIQGNDNIMYVEDSPVSSTTGELRMFYYENNIKTYYRTFGSVNYPEGIIIMPELEITGVVTGVGTTTLELIIKPQSNDVVSVRNQLVVIDPETINVNIILDPTSLGDPAGGANYIFSSSRN